MKQNLLSTIRTIILSRIKKPQTTQEVEFKRKQCKTCEYNTLNIEKLPLKKRLIKLLSDFYSWITNNRKVDVLGGCSICGCSVYYKTIDEQHCPHPSQDKWQSIYLPNSAQKNKKLKKWK